MNKITKIICKHKILIVIITLLLCIPALIGYKNTKINYDILVYLPKDIETLKGANILAEDFKMGAFSMVVVDNMPAKDILDLEDKFKNIDSVEHVLSLTDITGTTIPINMLPSKIVKKFSNGNSQLMIVTFKNSTSDEKTLDAVSKMRKMTDEKVKIGGMSAMVLDTKELFNNEMLLYVIIAVILCIIVLELFLDSYLIPFLLMVNIGIAILFNMGSNILLGNISYITKAIAAVLQLGVTTDFSIFLYHKYESLKKEYKNKNDAMAIAIHDTFVSVFGSSLTTIAGFLALCTMNLTLGTDIGIVMAKGVLIGVICVLTLFPALLLIFDKQIEKTSHKVITPKFTGTKNFVMKHYKIIFICFIILLIPAFYFQSKTNVYYKLDESIPDDYGYSIATKTLKEDYNMVSQAIVLVDRNKKDYEINNMIEEIEKIDGVNKVISPTELSGLGITEKMVNQKIKDIYETDKYKMILITSKYDIATNELNNQVEHIEKVIKKYDENAILAGEGPLMKDLVVISDQDFRNVNFTSIAIIFIIMLIVLKSISLPVLLVTAIEFAIFINMGIPYLTNTTLPFIASVVIGTIQLGATIDYAILLTTKYLEERKTKDKYKSVKEALDTSVSSIFVSAMCFFAATIGVGLVSKIDMIGSLCRLMSRGAIISMLVVVLIVPSILLIFDKVIIKTTKGFKKKEGFNMKNKLAILLLMTLFIPFNVMAATKNETVYSVINSEGKSETTVTEILDEIDGDVIDESDLENILNINGEEQYFKDDKRLTWKSNGNPIYYQGTTNKKLPIDIKVTYYLNNNEVNVKTINGKKGHIKIKIDYKNNERHGDLYTPFIVTMASIIKGDATNVTISTGKVIANGKQNIAIGIAAPGLYESLNMDELESLDGLVIEYDTTSFEESDIYNVYTPNLLSDDSLEIFDKLDEIYGKVDTLSSSSSKLVDGSKKLSSGISELNKGTHKLSNELNSKINDYTKLKDKYSNKEELEKKVIEIVNKEIKALKPELENLAYEEAKNVIKNNLKGKDGLENRAVETTLTNSKEILNKKIDNLKITLPNDLLSKVKNDVLKSIDNLQNNDNIKSLSKTIKQMVLNNISKTVKDKTQEVINKKIKEMKKKINDPIKLLPQAEAKALSDKIDAMAQAMAPSIKAQYNLTDEQALAKAKEMASELVSTVAKKTMDTTLDQVVDKSSSIAEETFQQITANINADGALKQAILEYEKLVITQLKANLDSDTIKAIQDSIKKELVKEIKNNINDIDKYKKEILNVAGNELSDSINEIVDSSSKSLAEEFTEKLTNEIAQNLIKKQLEDGVNKTELDKTISKYKSLINEKLGTVDTKLDELKIALKQLTDGTDKLENGSKELADGMEKFDNEGIKKIASFINNDVKDKEIKIRELIELGKNYDTFTKKNNNMSGETKFIVKIEA